MKKGQATTIIIIAVLVIIAVTLVVIAINLSNKPTTTGQGIKEESKKIICNSPYIQVGSNCCLDKNSNNVCDSDEEQIVLPTADDLDIQLKWGELYDVTASTSPDGEGEYCPNKKVNEGDIWADIYMRNVNIKKPSWVAFRCKSQLIVGESKYLFQEIYRGDLSKINGYHVDGRLASTQHLRKPHSFEVCCNSYNSNDISESVDFCKRFDIEPYC